jgi:hypothetical protein
MKAEMGTNHATEEAMRAPQNEPCSVKEKKVAGIIPATCKVSWQARNE